VSVEIQENWYKDYKAADSSANTKLQTKNVKGTDHVGDLRVAGRATLKWIIRNRA